MFKARWLALGSALLLSAVAAGAAGGASSAVNATVGTSFPAGFPTITDASLGTPVLGFGAAGRVKRTPVIFLHGNNDTPFPTACNAAYGKIHDLAQAFVDRGYSPSEVWGLGYQGDQCDLASSPTNRSAVAHTTAANVDDLARFVKAVLAYTGAKRVDIVGHSLGGTLAREWMRRDDAYHSVRHLVTIASPHHGITDCSPSPLNYFALPALGGFNPNSAICVELGAADTPFLTRLNRNETPGPTKYLGAQERGRRLRLHLGARRAVLPGRPCAGPQRQRARLLCEPRAHGQARHQRRADRPRRVRRLRGGPPGHPRVAADAAARLRLRGQGGRRRRRGRRLRASPAVAGAAPASERWARLRARLGAAA